MQAQANLDRLLRPSAADLEAARQAVVQAESQHQKLLQPSTADLEAARQAVFQAESQRQKLLQPSATDLEIARQAVRQAAAQRQKLFAVAADSDLATAQAAVDQAQASLDRLQATRPFEIVASRQSLAQAEAQLALQQAPPTAAALEEAEAALARADTALAGAKQALENTALRAPFGGTVAALSLREGERVGTGTQVITLVDLSRLVIETRDLDENGVARVAAGQPVEVLIYALEYSLTGSIARIDPLGETVSGGDTMYTATVALSEEVPGLRPGMTTKVDFTDANPPPEPQDDN